MVMNPMVESIKNHLQQTHVESGQVNLNFHDFPCKSTWRSGGGIFCHIFWWKLFGKLNRWKWGKAGVARKGGQGGKGLGVKVSSPVGGFEIAGVITMGCLGVVKTS